MANEIRMTPSQMRERANQYQAESGNVAEVISRMDTLLSQLQSEWTGAASDAYATRYTELKPSFVAMQDLIAEISTALNKTAEIVEQTDAEIANQFKA